MEFSRWLEERETILKMNKELNSAPARGGARMNEQLNSATAGGGARMNEQLNSATARGGARVRAAEPRAEAGEDIG
jgi:hypothetical protein